MIANVIDKIENYFRGVQNYFTEEKYPKIMIYFVLFLKFTLVVLWLVFVVCAFMFVFFGVIFLFYIQPDLLSALLLATFILFLVLLVVFFRGVFKYQRKKRIQKLADKAVTKRRVNPRYHDFFNISAEEIKEEIERRENIKYQRR